MAGTAKPATLASATLINNAGVIPALVPLSDSEPAELAQALRVGLEAPMQLTAAFLGATRSWALPRKVLNISSGLGRRAMASQAAYCAAKAGMDHFTRCVALDEALQANGAKVCSLAPGVIDTDMQLQLRSADATQFPDLGSFAGLHAQGQLSSPAGAARRVLAYLAREDFGKDAVGMCGADFLFSCFYFWVAPLFWTPTPPAPRPVGEGSLLTAISCCVAPSTRLLG